MAYNHLFGPVPSRRLGLSLGVDLVPHKVCSLNCVYCECGETTTLTESRQEYIPYAAVIEELEHFFHHQPAPDYITFSGSGEPTLNSRIGDVIGWIRKEHAGVPLAVLTNGTLFSDPALRRELLPVDLLLPSLDAADVRAFRRINRPPQGADIAAIIQGLSAFRREFNGEIWLEVFILPGFNDDRENLNLLKQAIERIAPDRVQLNTLDRPGALAGLRPAAPELFERLKTEWSFPGLEVIAPSADKRREAAFREDIEQVILETVTRRPCTLDDLIRITNLRAGEINKYLSILEADGKIEASEMARGVFYQAAGRLAGAPESG